MSGPGNIQKAKSMLDSSLLYCKFDGLKCKYSNVKQYLHAQQGQQHVLSSWCTNTGGIGVGVIEQYGNMSHCFRCEYSSVRQHMSSWCANTGGGGEGVIEQCENMSPTHLSSPLQCRAGQEPAFRSRVRLSSAKLGNLTTLG